MTHPLNPQTHHIILDTKPWNHQVAQQQAHLRAKCTSLQILPGFPSTKIPSYITLNFDEQPRYHYDFTPTTLTILTNKRIIHLEDNTIVGIARLSDITNLYHIRNGPFRFDEILIVAPQTFSIYIYFGAVCETIIDLIKLEKTIDHFVECEL